MKTLSSLALLALANLAAAQVPQSLPPDHYLVGTQGWLNNSINSTLNTIQVISPYTGTATDLKVTGLAQNQAPACFHIQTNTSFIVGTKSLNTTVATGNLYRVRYTNTKTGWVATRLNPNALPINASDIVVSGDTIYVIGSRTFNKSATDAQILRVSLTTGAVSVHLLIGNFYQVVQPTGALGIGMSLVIVGQDLHAFTFDTTNTTPLYNEHWRVSLSWKPAVTYQRLGALPPSKRYVSAAGPHGFGTTGAFIDPENPRRIVVVGTCGELVRRDLNTNTTIGYEAFSGPFQLTALYYDQVWRGVALNTNTHAFAMGDHEGAAIDERRIQNSPTATEVFSMNIAKAIQPPLTGTVIFTIAGMEYIPAVTKSSYRVIGAGCADGTNGIPTSYATGAPARGNPSFGFSLYSRPKGVSRVTAATLLISGNKSKTGLPIPPGCRLWIDLNSLAIAAPLGSTTTNILETAKFPLPSTSVTVYTQWALFAPGANAWNMVLSDARALNL